MKHPPSDFSTSSPLRRAGAHRGEDRGITTHLLALLADPVDVGAAGDVPHGNVLLHATGQAAALLGGQGGTGGRDTGIVAVLVDFLETLY